MKTGSFDIVALKRTALSSHSEALEATPRMTAIIIRYTDYFPHLSEIVSFWLRRAASPDVLLLSLEPAELDVQAACLRGVKDYMYLSREGGRVIRRRVSDLWPVLVDYAAKLFSEFSSNLNDLTLPEYIPAILEPLSVIIADMTNPVVDSKGGFYKTLMSDLVLNSMLKSWIKIFSTVECYSGAHRSMNRCLATPMHMEKKAGCSSEQYASVLQSIPDDIAVSCAHRVKSILRAAHQKDVTTIVATLQFLVITASAPASFRVVLFHHGTMTTVLKLLCSLARRPPPGSEDIPHVCATYLNLGLTESDRNLPFTRGAFESLLLPPNSVTYGLSMLSEDFLLLLVQQLRGSFLLLPRLSESGLALASEQVSRRIQMLSIAFSKSGYRVAIIEHLIRYEVFSSPRKAAIAESRAGFVKRHPELELREVGLTIDFTVEHWPVQVCQFDDTPLHEYPKGGLCVMWKVPFPSMTVTTSGFCAFDSAAMYNYFLIERSRVDISVAGNLSGSRDHSARPK
ncbi:hypothetical protein BDZ89DRAFT_1261638 [Hymenopellis radicata]|nr:hypothetical protein BDZ89DRAFT_1261638 [Hymenopellis radicata]